MFLGAFMASFMGGGSTAVNELIEAANEFSNSFETFSLKSIGDVFYTGGVFLFELLQFVGSCIYWNFAFFEGFEWIQMILIFINIAILMKIMFDTFRAFKPFGS
jgi:hypothetical protein